MHFKKEGISFHQVDKLGMISLIIAMGLSLVMTIWAVYLESLIHNASYVSFLSTFFTVVAAIAFIASVPFIEKNNKAKIFMISLFLYALAYLSFAFLKTIVAVIVLGAVVSIIGSFRITSFGIILRDKSKASSVSKNVSLIYTFMNVSWIIGPLIAGFISEKFGLTWVFISSAAFIIFALILFKSFNIQDNRVEKKVDKNIFKISLDFFKDKNRVLVYLMTAGCTFWWALIYLYIPLHLYDTGNVNLIGYFLFGIGIPLVLLEYFFGKMTARKGFRKMFFFGYLILSLCALACFFFIGNVYVLLGILIFASIGAAMVEPTVESYFFDIVKQKERDKFYGPYNTSLDAGHAVATFFGAFILMYFDFRYILIFYASIMLVLALISFKIKNIIEEKRKR